MRVCERLGRSGSVCLLTRRRSLSLEHLYLLHLDKGTRDSEVNSSDQRRRPTTEEEDEMMTALMIRQNDAQES